MKRSAFINSVKSLDDICKELNIGILHSHHRYCELLANSVRRKIPKKVFTALSIVDRRYFIDYRSQKIIAVSNSVKDLLTKKFGIPDNRIVVIPNFVDSTEAKKVKRLKHSSKVFTVLCVGRFHWEKDHMTLLKSMKLLRSKNIQLVLAGEGELEESLKSFAVNENLKVSFQKPAPDLTSLFESADMCILASVRDALPTFMLQSGLHKIPFAGTNVDGIAEVISNRFNGLLFEPGNAASAAEAILRIQNNSVESLELADRLYRKVSDEYTEKTALPSIDSIYDDLFNDKKR